MSEEQLAALRMLRLAYNARINAINTWRQLRKDIAARMGSDGVDALMEQVYGEYEGKPEYVDGGY